MAKNYGLPYMGSKSKIAEKIVTEIIWNEPNAQIFIDLFAGGCAISHAAILSGSFKKVYANDINAMPKLFKDAIDGKYKDEKRWISRDEFRKLKNSDMYVKSCWSFGNNGNGYLYGKHLEPYKKAYHYARVLGDFSLFNQFAPYIEQEHNGNLYKYIKDNQDRIKKDYLRWRLAKMGLNDIEIKEVLNATREDYKTEAERLRQNLQRLESLQNLQNLQNLQRLESLESDIIEISQGGYQDFKLPPPDKCVIYCDIPYKNTEGYIHDGEKIEFDHEAFYSWCRDKAKQGYKIYMSEYQMPSDFDEILTIETQSLLSSKAPKKVKEKLFSIEI